MRLALMQPYVFPYMGYFNLIASVDRFVFYDDVNFIKNGWINRNRLLVGGAVRYFTLPLASASSFAKINEVELVSGDRWREKMTEAVRHSYHKAPQFKPVFELFRAVIHLPTDRIATVAKASVHAVARHLGIQTSFVESSVAYGNAKLVGEERVLDICRLEHATHYHNVPGGRALYDPARFRDHGICLQFVEPVLAAYPQGQSEFHPGLSIIDVLMHNEPGAVKAMLAGYTLG